MSIYRKKGSHHIGGFPYTALFFIELLYLFYHVFYILVNL